MSRESSRTNCYFSNSRIVVFKRENKLVVVDFKSLLPYTDHYQDIHSKPIWMIPRNPKTGPCLFFYVPVLVFDSKYQTSRTALSPAAIVLKVLLFSHFKWFFSCCVSRLILSLPFCFVRLLQFQSNFLGKTTPNRVHLEETVIVGEGRQRGVFVRRGELMASSSSAVTTAVATIVSIIQTGRRRRRSAGCGRRWMVIGWTLNARVCSVGDVIFRRVAFVCVAPSFVSSYGPTAGCCWRRRRWRRGQWRPHSASALAQQCPRVAGHPGRIRPYWIIHHGGSCACIKHAILDAFSGFKVFFCFFSLFFWLFNRLLYYPIHPSPQQKNKNVNK